MSSAAAQGPSGRQQEAIFNVRNYGATGDGKTLDTAAINRAIVAAADGGGGTVELPAGSYLCFSLHLRSHVHLHLQSGAAIVAADSPKPGEATGYNGGVYDAAEPNTPWEAYQDFGHNHWHNSLLWGENLENISITGPGLIWGRGLSHGRDREMIGFPFIAEQTGVGNKAIALKNCRNVLFRDFAILKGGHFGLLLTGVDNLTIDNLTIDTDRDGIDIDCCRNVRVTGCTVNSPWDDAICPKSSYALGYPRATENVTISDCYVTGTYELGSVLDGSWKKFGEGSAKPGFYTGRIKCGTESNGGFRNIAITNCIFEGCQGLALESMDGALLEDITVSNLAMRDLVTAPFFFRLGARLRGPKQTTKVGTLRRVLVDNVVSTNAGAEIGSILTGIPGYSLEDIRLSNVFVEQKGAPHTTRSEREPTEQESEYPDPSRFGYTPSQGFFLRHIRALEMSHIEVRSIAPDPRPAFFLRDVQRVDFLACTAASGQPAFSLNDVRDLRILMSRAASDTVLGGPVTRTL